MRLIDADELHAEISKWPESVMYKDWVQSAIANCSKNSKTGSKEAIKRDSLCSARYRRI